jgi:aspartate/methionine/tyrosine aminotransferase
MRDLCVASIQQLKGFSCIAPEGCYVAFANIEQTGLSSKEIHALLLEKAKVAIVPGLKEWFGQGAEGYIRFSFATSEAILVEAFDRIHQTISSR